MWYKLEKLLLIALIFRKGAGHANDIANGKLWLQLKNRTVALELPYLQRYSCTVCAAENLLWSKASLSGLRNTEHAHGRPGYSLGFRKHHFVMQQYSGEDASNLQ